MTSIGGWGGQHADQSYTEPKINGQPIKSIVSTKQEAKAEIKAEAKTGQYEAILAAIDKLNKFYSDTGEINGEQYCKLLQPLHDALAKTE